MKNIIKLNNIKNSNITYGILDLLYSIRNVNIENNFHKYLKDFFEYATINPIEFLKIFLNKHSQFRDGQQDCNEFIRIVLEDISYENNLIEKNNNNKYINFEYIGKSKAENSIKFHEFFLKKENSFVVNNFYIQIINNFKCECGYNSYNFEKILDLPLLIPSDEDYRLTDLIKINLSGDNNVLKKNCSNCLQTNVNHIKKIEFDILNNILP